jgi:hypothetical protein
MPAGSGGTDLVSSAQRCDADRASHFGGIEHTDPRGRLGIVTSSAVEWIGRRMAGTRREAAQLALKNASPLQAIGLQGRLQCARLPHKSVLQKRNGASYR